VRKSAPGKPWVGTGTLVRPVGFEPTTFSSGGCRAIHLMQARRGEGREKSTACSGKLLIPKRLRAKRRELATHLATRKVCRAIRAPRAGKFLASVEHSFIASADRASLRQELGEILPVEDHDEISWLAPKRQGHPEDGYERRRPRTAFNFADAEAEAFRQIDLRKPCFWRSSRGVTGRESKG
jgi:hypothetical protein